MKFSTVLASAVFAIAVSATEEKHPYTSMVNDVPAYSTMSSKPAESPTTKAVMYSTSSNMLPTTSSKADNVPTTSTMGNVIYTTSSKADVIYSTSAENVPSTSKKVPVYISTSKGAATTSKKAGPTSTPYKKMGNKGGKKDGGKYGVIVTPSGPVTTVDTHIQIDTNFTVKTTEDLTLPNGLVIRLTDITTISEKIKIDVKVVASTIMDVCKGIKKDVTLLTQTISIKYSLSSDLVFALADNCRPLFKPDTDFYKHFQTISDLRTNQAVVTTINQSQRAVFKIDTGLFFNGQQFLDIATITTFSTKVGVKVEIFGSVFTEFSRFKPSDDYRAHCRYVADKYKIQVPQVLQIASVCAPAVQQVPQVAPVVTQIATYQAPQVESMPVPAPEAVYAPQKMTETVVVADASVPMNETDGMPSPVVPMKTYDAPSNIYSGAGVVAISAFVALMTAVMF
ncbi:hypothetical protein BC830DRAFT_1100737 [Chytriomyces sp. MP71]|nr:hypothetical protein BC830DRAFT_1100737 [Chytriomyces sp. MP71]